jgi:hypothetical protein
MRLFKATFKDRSGNKQTAKKWYIEFPKAGKYNMGFNKIKEKASLKKCLLMNSSGNSLTNRLLILLYILLGNFKQNLYIQ